MELKYKVIQDCEDYKIVEFQHSFYKNLKKTLTRQSNKYYNLLNPIGKVRNMFTRIPTQYNGENVKTSLMIQDLIDNEALGVIVDCDESLFAKIFSSIDAVKNNSCCLKINGVNLIIAPDEVNSINELKNILSNEISKYKNTQILKEQNFATFNLSFAEQEFIQNILKEEAIDLMDENIEIPEDILRLTNLPLAKLIIDRRKMREMQKIFELLEISYRIINNAFYFEKRDKDYVNEYAEKLIDGEIKITDKVYEINRNNNEMISLLPRSQNKHKFEYKDIDELLKSKTDTAIKNDGIEWIEPEQIIK